MDSLNVLLIADDPLARSGLAGLFSDFPDCTIVGQMSSIELLGDAGEIDWPGLPADLILWDFGWDATLPGDFPETLTLPYPLLALIPDATMAAELWQRGVRAMLPRQGDPAEILAGMQTAVRFLITLHPDFAPSLLPALRSGDNDLAGNVSLTDREMDVLDLLAEGLTNRAIAQELEISDHTVKFHVNAIMGKLEAQSRTEAVVRATRLGLLSL
jgi:DNA-binding NarL/FixJ family response regulator